MNAPISNPADCEVRGVIRFLQAENVSKEQVCAFYCYLISAMHGTNKIKLLVTRTTALGIWQCILECAEANATFLFLNVNARSANEEAGGTENPPEDCSE